MQTVVQPGDGQVQPAALLVVTTGKLLILEQAFYINLVIGAVFSPAYLFLLPGVDVYPEVSLMQRITKQTDWLGIIVFAGAMTTFVMAISFGGSVYSWDSKSEIVLWVLSALLIIAFALTQFFHPLVSEEYKLYPTHFLRKPVMVLLQVQMVCAAVALFVSWTLIGF